MSHNPPTIDDILASQTATAMPPAELPEGVALVVGATATVQVFTGTAETQGEQSAAAAP